MSRDQSNQRFNYIQTSFYQSKERSRNKIHKKWEKEQQRQINQLKKTNIQIKKQSKQGNKLLQSKKFVLWKQDQLILKKDNINQKEHFNFKIKIQESKQPPIKKQPFSSKLSKLKSQITPVEQIWSKCIKQYLNDFQFVQIYRKHNFLSVKYPKYGQTIIKYQNQVDQTESNEYKFVQRAIFSRAYFKLWQIISEGVFSDVQKVQCNVACLAEGPGGFIHALIDYRKKQNPFIKDNFFAITLKVSEQQYIQRNSTNDWSNSKAHQYFENLKNQKYNINLSYGLDDTGNLLKIQNINYFQKVLMKNEKAFLVTGDGGIQCSTDNQFHYQQITNAKLFFAEILTALKVQKINGIFILKIYDCYFDITKELIVLLCTFYKRVQVIKPATSRPGNSEKYLKCTGFKGISLEAQNQLQKLLLEWNMLQFNINYFQNSKFAIKIIQFNIQQIQQKIQNQMQKMNQVLCEEQQKKIEEGLNLIQKNNGSLQLIRKNISLRINQQIKNASIWCKFYGISTCI